MNLKIFKDGFKVDGKGMISLTEEQWDELCKYLHCAHFSYKYQKAMIKACINGAVERGLEAEKKKSKKK